MITKAEIVAQVQWGISYWEVHARNNEGQVIRIIDFPLYVAKEKGITKRLNGSKKMNEWLNSKEGLKYLNEKYVA